MKTSPTRQVLRTALFGLAALSAQAEIREIPAEEMTEAYIRDTTVVVRKQDDAGQKPAASVKVKTLDASFSEGEELNTERTTASPGSADTYQAEILNNDLASQTSFGFEATDPNQAVLEANLREVLGLAPGTPIDYNNLAFPTGLTTNVTPPPGISSTTTPGQFSISIPNSGNYASQSFSTPNGEYQVNVTPSDITFTLNLPQR